MNPFFTVFILILITGFVLLAAYFTTILISGKTNRYFQGRSVKVIERTPVTVNLSILVVQIYGKVYIIALQNRGIEVIDTMPIEEWKMNKESQEALQVKDIGYSFAHSFKDTKTKLKEIFFGCSLKNEQIKQNHRDDRDDQ